MKYFRIIVLLQLGWLTVMAEDTDIFFRQEYGQFIDSPVNLYEISQNPALFRNCFRDDIYYYSISADEQQNGYQRTYDPATIDNYQFHFISHKILSDKTSLTSRVYYHRNTNWKVYRSLEKDFYGSYFAFTDTTTGTVKYDGPDLSVMYSYNGRHLNDTWLYSPQRTLYPYAKK